MTNADRCPFCSQATEGIAKGGAGGYYDFDCLTCGRFDMASATFRRICNGKLNDMRPGLLDFISKTPAGKVAYIGEEWVTKGDGPAVYKLHKDYCPIKGI